MALSGTGVSPAQYAVYGRLSRGVSSSKGLLEVLGIRPAALSGYLSGMDRRGDLVRSRAPGDRRAHRLALTDQGRATYAACRIELRRAVRAVDRELGDAAEVDALRSALGRIDTAVREASRQLSPDP